METIVSERKTNQDVLNKTACSNCYHDVNEHSGKCFALDYDGSTYFACKCKQLKFEFKIALTVQNGNQDERDNKSAKFTRKSFSHN